MGLLWLGRGLGVLLAVLGLAMLCVGSGPAADGWLDGLADADVEAGPALLWLTLPGGLLLEAG